MKKYFIFTLLLLSFFYTNSLVRAADSVDPFVEQATDAVSNAASEALSNLAPGPGSAVSNSVINAGISEAIACTQQGFLALAFCQFANFINKIVGFIIGLAVLVFMLGLLKYIKAGGDTKLLDQARGNIIWGIIIMSVMISTWGLVKLVTNTFGLNIPNSTGVASCANFTSVKCIVGWITTQLNSYIVPTITGLTVFYFIWGLFKYVTAGGDDKKIKEAKDFIIYGIIFIAVMISIWGLVNIVVSTFFPSRGIEPTQIKLLQ